MIQENGLEIAINKLKSFKSDCEKKIKESQEHYPHIVELMESTISTIDICIESITSNDEITSEEESSLVQKELDKQKAIEDERRNRTIITVDGDTILVSPDPCGSGSLIVISPRDQLKQRSILWFRNEEMIRLSDILVKYGKKS